MPAPDPALALSAIELERVRELRARLNRRAISDAAALTLGTAFFQLCGRLGLAPAPAAVQGTAAQLKAQADTADMSQLCIVLAALKAAHAAGSKTWLQAVAAGSPQAVLSRRLALAGREQPVEV